jgi:hypothetical protein
MKALGIMATVLIPPAAVYIALQQIGHVPPEAVTLIRRAVVLTAIALALGLMVQARNTETKL